MTIDAYHNDVTADSHSSLELFAESRPAYYAQRIAKTLPRPTPTPAMVFGNVFGCLLLEGEEEFAKRYILAPKVDRRTIEGKQQWAEFQVSMGDRTIITSDDLAIAHAMRESVMANTWARKAIEADGRVECTMRWQDRDTGRPLKSRKDKILRNGLIVDLKTAASVKPDDLSRAVASFAYHRQAALYLTGAWECEQSEGPFIFLAVCKQPPHEVVSFTLDNDALRMGHEQNRALIGELAQCYETGDWSGRWSGEIQTIQLPRWAR